MRSAAATSRPKPASIAATSRGQFESFVGFGRRASRRATRSACSGRYRRRSPHLAISRPIVARWRPSALAISLSLSPQQTPTKIRSRSSNDNRCGEHNTRPSHQRRLILNVTRGGVRQAELGHHLPDQRPFSKPRGNRRALRRRHQPITPASTPSLGHLSSLITQHEMTIVLRRPDESTWGCCPNEQT